MTEYPALRPAEIGARADVAVVLGGDGTMLGIGRQLAPYRTPLIGINHGRVGFITDIPISDMQDLVPQMLGGHFEREERTLLEARIMRDGSPIYHALAFNDVVVNRSGFSGMAELHVFGRRPLHVQPALGRPDRRHADRLDGLFAVFGGADPASAVAGHRAGADRRRTRCRTGLSCCRTTRRSASRSSRDAT